MTLYPNPSSEAFIRLPVQIGFLAYTDGIQIDFIKATLCNLDWDPLLRKTKLNDARSYVAQDNNLSKTSPYFMEMMSYDCLNFVIHGGSWKQHVGFRQTGSLLVTAPLK